MRALTAGAGRLLSLAWRSRWNGIARAELRRSYRLRNAVSAAAWLAVLYGGLIWAWKAGGLAPAVGTARAVVALGWFVNLIARANSFSRVFVLETRQGVTEAWLLTSLPRGELLWSRLAGRSFGGPLVLLLMLPVYFLAALGLPGELFGLLVCGHLGRFAIFMAPTAPDAASVAAAAALAPLAVLADLAAGQAAASSALPGALQQVYLKRIFRRFSHSLAGHLSMLFRGLGHWLLYFLAEAACLVLAAAGLVIGKALGTDGPRLGYWGELVTAPSPSPPGKWPLMLCLGLLLAGLVCAGALAARWLVTRASVGLAARHFDDALIDDPGE